VLGAPVGGAHRRGELPTRTDLEATLTHVAGIAHRDGVIGLYETLAGHPDLGRYCVSDG
jgi:hypothetical protein